MGTLEKGVVYVVGGPCGPAVNRAAIDCIAVQKLFCRVLHCIQTRPREARLIYCFAVWYFGWYGRSCLEAVGDVLFTLKRICAGFDVCAFGCGGDRRREMR